MIEFGGCDKIQLQEVCESLATQLVQYEHSSWREVSEEDVYEKLREEGLSDVMRF